MAPAQSNDVVAVALKDAVLKLRLTQVDFGGNNIVAQAVAEDEIAYSSAAKGASVALLSTIIPIATPISALVMDLPMLRAEDDGLGFILRLDQGCRRRKPLSFPRWGDMGHYWDGIGSADLWLGVKRSGRAP